MAEIIKLHAEHIPANRLAHIGHDVVELGPGVHAVAVVVPLMALELESPLPDVPRLDAEVLFGVAEPGRRGEGTVVVVVAAGQGPAVFGEAFAARATLADTHGGGVGAAGPVEGVGVAELLGVVFEVHVGGELGVRVGVEVFGGTDAGDLAQGVEVRGPPDRVPDLEVFGPVVVVDGAGVGGVPGLVEAVVIGFRSVGEDGSFFFDGVVQEPSGDAVEDAKGACDGHCGFGVVDSGEAWAGGGGWVTRDFDGRLGDIRICRLRIDGDMRVCGRDIRLCRGDMRVCRRHCYSDIRIRRLRTDDDMRVCRRHGDSDIRICRHPGDQGGRCRKIHYRVLLQCSGLWE